MDEKILTVTKITIIIISMSLFSSHKILDKDGEKMVETLLLLLTHLLKEKYDLEKKERKIKKEGEEDQKEGEGESREREEDGREGKEGEGGREGEWGVVRLDSTSKSKFSQHLVVRLPRGMVWRTNRSFSFYCFLLSMQ